MAGLVPAIHVLLSGTKTWMPGTKAGHDECVCGYSRNAISPGSMTRGFCLSSSALYQSFRISHSVNAFHFPTGGPSIALVRIRSIPRRRSRQITNRPLAATMAEPTYT